MDKDEFKLRVSNFIEHIYSKKKYPRENLDAIIKINKLLTDIVKDKHKSLIPLPNSIKINELTHDDMDNIELSIIADFIIANMTKLKSMIGISQDSIKEYHRQIHKDYGIDINYLIRQSFHPLDEIQIKIHNWLTEKNISFKFNVRITKYKNLFIDFQTDYGYINLVESNNKHNLKKIQVAKECNMKFIMLGEFNENILEEFLINDTNVYVYKFETIIDGIVRL